MKGLLVTFLVLAASAANASVQCGLDVLDRNTGKTQTLLLQKENFAGTDSLAYRDHDKNIHATAEDLDNKNQVRLALIIGDIQVLATVPYNLKSVLKFSESLVFADNSSNQLYSLKCRQLESEKKATVQVQGKLVGHMAIGGESTGFAIKTANGKLIEVLLSNNVNISLNQEVTVRGYYIEKSGVEIAKRKILVVTEAN